MEAVIEKLPQSGHRPITRVLKKTRTIGKKRVIRIMREQSLKIRQKQAYKPQKTTDSKHSFRKYPNLLLDKENSIYKDYDVIVGDATYYDIMGKTHYLAHLLHLKNREPVGYAVSNKLDTDLMKNVLLMTIEKFGGSLKGFIHHTDSDSRYCSAEYIRLLEKAGATISMCKGNAYENAHSESFNSVIKREEINGSDYQSKEESAESIFKFFETYTNYRPHSALNMMTPNECKLKNLRKE
jgi:putative transposase